MNATTTMNIANATTTIKAAHINALLMQRPYVILEKDGKRVFEVKNDIAFNGDPKNILNGTGILESVDGIYKITNLVNITAVSAEEITKANRRYRIFDRSGMNNTIIGVERPMDIALNKAGMTEDDIISVSISDVFAIATAAKEKQRQIAIRNAHIINESLNRYGIRIYDEKVYVAIGGWTKGSTIIEMYDVIDMRGINDVEIKKGLALSQVFMPSVRTSSMKNAGEKFFVVNNKVDAFERALCAGISLNDRFMQLSNGGILAVSMRQLMKEWKYMPSVLAGRVKLDLSKCRIAVIDEKGRVGDGNGSANPDLVGVEDKTALQMRLRIYQGKGVLMCEKNTFAFDLEYLNHINAINPEKVTYYGDPSLPVGVIVDRNFIKMLDQRLDIVPEIERTSWIIHEFRELSKSEMSIDECAKWLRRCSNDEDKKIVMDMFINGFKKSMQDKMIQAFTPDTDSEYLPSMLKGIDKWSTIKSLDSMFNKFWSADCRPTAWMGGYTLGLTQHPIFNADGDAYRKTRGENGLSVIFVNTETWEKLGRPSEAVLTKFPSPSERGAVRVAVRINDSVCSNCIGFDMSIESMALLEAMSGADCDGDKANFMATVIEKNSENVRTWIGRILENSGYRHMTVKNILPEIADKVTVNSVLEMHIKDMNAQSGMTGVMVSAMNVIKLNAKGNPDAPAYIGRFDHITEMRIDDIYSWIQYIGSNGENVKIDDSNRAAWWLDCGLVQDWLAEFTTGLSGSGVQMPEDLRNYFCSFKNYIVSYWVKSIEETNKSIIAYNNLVSDGKKKVLISTDKNMLVRRLTIGNFKLYKAVEEAISDSAAWAQKRITEIKWVSDNAMTVEEFCAAHHVDASRVDVRFGYVGNYLPAEYRKCGVGHISAASHNLGNSDAWKYEAGTMLAAKDLRRSKKETNGQFTIRYARVEQLCNAIWESKYSTMFMIPEYLRKIGYNVTEDVANSYKKEYEGKYALPIVLYKSDKENDYTTTLAAIKSGSIVTGTIKGDRFVVGSTINGKNKNVGLQIATESDLLINGLNLHIDQLVNARVDEYNNREYYVALCSII